MLPQVGTRPPLESWVNRSVKNCPSEAPGPISISWASVRITLPILNPIGLQVQVFFFSVQASGCRAIPAVAEEPLVRRLLCCDAHPVKDAIKSMSISGSDGWRLAMSSLKDPLSRTRGGSNSPSTLIEVGLLHKSKV